MKLCIKEALQTLDKMRQSVNTAVEERLSRALCYSLPVKRMLTGQNSQLVFDLEVFQTYGACLLCGRQTGRRQRGACNKTMLRCKSVFSA